MKNYQTLLWLTLFSIAMGFLETSVVVYLRELYYPAGFNFPLVPIQQKIAITELLREAATIIMLAAIALLTGRNKLESFSFFLYAFAIWDLFYYIFLKILLDWPASLLTWDILFLIPIPWLGPVLAPCIVSATFILFNLLVLKAQRVNADVSLHKSEKALLGLGGIIIVISFIYTWLNEVHPKAFKNAFLLDNLKTYVPETFNWFLFILGELALIAAAIGFAIRNKLHFIRTKVSWKPTRTVQGCFLLFIERITGV